MRKCKGKPAKKTSIQRLAEGLRAIAIDFKRCVTRKLWRDGGRQERFLP